MLYARSSQSVHFVLSKSCWELASRFFLLSMAKSIFAEDQYRKAVPAGVKV